MMYRLNQIIIILVIYKFSLMFIVQRALHKIAAYATPIRFVFLSAVELCQKRLNKLVLEWSPILAQCQWVFGGGTKNKGMFAKLYILRTLMDLDVLGLGFIVAPQCDCDCANCWWDWSSDFIFISFIYLSERQFIHIIWPHLSSKTNLRLFATVTTYTSDERSIARYLWACFYCWQLVCFV